MYKNVTFKFDNRRALVTGAGNGIGKEIAVALSEAGAETFAMDISTEGLNSLAEEHPTIRTVCVDLRDHEAVRKAVEQILPIDLLVNNAGVTKVENFEEARLEAFDFMIDVNAKAPINISQVIVKDLIARKLPGSIVNISSQSSLRALEGHTNYSASKSAVDMITRTMALELGKHNIRTNSVHPTIVMTDMGKQVWHDEAKAGPMRARIPMGRFAEPSEIVGPVLFLLSDCASMVNGLKMIVDGGYTVS